jgi:hypothetical protein
VNSSNVGLTDASVGGGMLSEYICLNIWCPMWFTISLLDMERLTPGTLKQFKFNPLSCGSH